jgi:hypothetical protein
VEITLFSSFFYLGDHRELNDVIDYSELQKERKKERTRVRARERERERELARRKIKASKQQQQQQQRLTRFRFQKSSRPFILSLSSQVVGSNYRWPLPARVK